MINLTPYTLSILVFMPILMAFTTLMLKKAPMRLAIIATMSIQFTTILQLIIQKLSPLSPIFIGIGGWEAPIGIRLKLTGVTLIISLMIIGLIAALQLFSSYYFEDIRDVRKFVVMSFFLLSAALVTIFSNDLFNIYVGFELLGISAIALMLMRTNKATIEAALRYFFVAFSGSLLYLFGVAILYRTHATLDLDILSTLITPTPANQFAIAVIIVALLLKTAIVPFHFWLPPAHSKAEAPVSAILSAIVVKLSFIILLRLMMGPFFEISKDMIWVLFSVFGIIAVLYGAIKALTQTRLKMIIAYSTVSQLGYLMSVFSLPIINLEIRSVLWTGVVYFIITHALAKTGLFLCAGEFMSRYQTDKLDQLNGTLKTAPAILFSYTLFAISIAGLPPSGGFIAKWQLLKYSLLSGHWPWTITILSGGILSSLYLYPVIANGFKLNETPPTITSPPNSKFRSVIIVLLAIISVALMFFANKPLEIAKMGGFLS